MPNGQIGRTLFERAVMFDSSPLIALFDESDNRGIIVADTLVAMQQRGWPFCICELTLAETHNRIRQDVSAEEALEFLATTFLDIEAGDLNLLEITPQDRIDALRILQTYSDQSLSYTDAMTMAIMTRIGILRVLSFDWHFTLLGFVPIPPLGEI